MNQKLNAKIYGGQIPQGAVTVSGAKNSATRLLAASLISDELVTLKNFPTELVDAKYKIDLIRKCNGSVTVDKSEECLTIQSSDLTTAHLDSNNYPIRTTYLLVAGQIKKAGRAIIPYPGGCKIGNRGYELHSMVWEKLGAKVREYEDYLEISVENGFKPAEINFPILTIGGTENALICASTINGETIIKNAYISPEVEDLIRFLKSIGSQIDVVGNSYVKVRGKNYLQGAIFSVMPDRIEALTWMIYGVLAKGDITIKDVPFKAMEIPLIHIKEAGIDFYHNDRNVRITPDCLVNGSIQPFELACGTHPGIISDMQPFFVLLGLYANGISRIFDYRYPERLKYCEELSKFYPGQLTWEKGKITTSALKKQVKAATAQSTDLRGSMAVVIAGLLADGCSEICNYEMALRGYNNLHSKLADLGISLDVTELQ